MRGHIPKVVIDEIQESMFNLIINLPREAVMWEEYLEKEYQNFKKDYKEKYGKDPSEK